MEGFEHIRKSAFQLHNKVVAAGASAISPKSLMSEALKQLDLELFCFPHSDPALKGARALFDEQSGTIFCEETDNPTEKAELVTHEIGHSILHTGAASCTQADIDASRSEESAPVGLQRVEDYGVRERRELQANVFAREFLLPRSLARDLFMNERLGAMEIATKSGLSINLVRQQLFDALLLPSQIPEEIPSASHSMNEDESQERAARHRGTAFQLQAGPGTGKTRTLVKAVLSLLEEGIHPSSILILTFSNRAAGELTERIVREAGADASQIWIGTFHAFGLDLLRRFHDRLDLSKEPKLFDRSDAIEVLEEILPTLPLNHYRNLWDPVIELREMISAISRAKDELTGPDDYRRLSQAMLDAAEDEDERVAAEKCLEVAEIYRIYEEALRIHGSVDFGDLIMKPTLLLESDQVLRSIVQLRHRHVFVDEYQDVNRASARLVKAVAGDGKRLWVVGDARQSIYRFRGASSTNMVMFGKDYPQATVDSLSISYRSTSEIVKTIQSIAPKMGASEGMLPLSLKSIRGSNLKLPQIRRYESPDDESAGIAASIQELNSQGIQLRDQAVLCRTHQRLNEIASALEARNIPVLHLGSLFEREEIREMLSLLSLAVDWFGDALVKVGMMPRYSLSMQDVYLATRHYRKSMSVSLSDLKDSPGLSSGGKASIKRLIDDLDGIVEKTPWEFLSTYLLDRTDLLRNTVDKTSVSGEMQGIALWQFLNFARATSPVGQDHPIRRLLNRVRQLVLFAEERDLRQVPPAALHIDAVRLMTVHGSKGLEFEVVHIPNLTVGSFPTSYRGQRCPPPAGMIEGAILSVAEQSKQSHDNEEECLFFVALSRARSYLQLHLPTKSLSGRKKNPSRFLSWFDQGLVDENISPETMAISKVPIEPSLIKIENIEQVYLTDHSIQLYDSCPLRFFYTHVLRLAGAKKSTAFSQTHDCIYSFVEWLVVARQDGEVSFEEAELSFDAIWEERGPKDHGFAADYRHLASTLIHRLVRSGESTLFREAEALVVAISETQIFVSPNEVIENPDGSITLRKIRTGKKRKSEEDRLEYTLYLLAGKDIYGKNCTVEVFHLTDGVSSSIELTTTKLKNRQIKVENMVAGIGGGQFPANPDQFSCPRCPHFFYCPSIPSGILTLDTDNED